MADLKPGDIIGGYRIERKIAQGGMGSIYRACHVDLDRVAAIKVLNEELTTFPAVIKRFLREGKLIAKLDHPGIIRIFDLGKADDFYYLAMEFVEGKDLQQLMAEDGALPPSKALNIVHQVADALDYAHSEGIIHRDIKPSNIILSADGSIRVTDFGIARLQQQDTLLTQAGTIIGTPVYMSPEQCQGNAIDCRSDLYSLGATLYTLVSGKPPFESTIPATLIKQVLHDNPVSPDTIVTNLPPGVVSLVRRLMAKYPGARYQTGRELCRAIEELERSGGRIPPQAPARSARDAQRETPWLKTLFIGSSICLLTVGIHFLWYNANDSEAYSTENPPGQSPQKVPVATPKRAPKEKPRRSSSKSASELRREVEERSERFADALLSGKEEKSVVFVDPKLRTSSSLLLTLGRVIQKIDALGPDAYYTYSLSFDGQKADVFYEFKNDLLSLSFGLTWIRKGDDWYFRPQETEE